LAPGLASRDGNHPPGTDEMVRLSCGFGNSLTLPLVLLLSLVPAGAMAERAVSYTALFLAGWSPLLWTVGYRALGSLEGQDCSLEGRFRRRGSSLAPLAGISQAPFEGATGPRGRQTTKGRLPLPAGASSAGAPASQDRLESVDVSVVDVDVAADPADAAGRAPPPPSPAEEDGGRSLSESARLARSVWAGLAPLREVSARVLNPPLCGILLGCGLGFSPLAAVFAGGGQGAAAPVAARVSLEAALIVGSVRSAFDACRMLGTATLPVQAVVLASSLYREEAPGAGEVAGAVTGLPKRSGLLPAEPSERRALVAIAVTRLLLMPLAGLALYLAARGLLPRDPLCHLAVLVQAAMPPAQNLVVIMQLRDSTQPLARRFARLVVRLYALAAASVAVWTLVFCSVTGVRLGSL